jgi:hypothetical protein
MDSTKKNRQVPPLWGDDMESALIARDRALHSQARMALPPLSRRITLRIVLVICATALLGFLLVLLLIGNTHQTVLTPETLLANRILLNQTNTNQRGSFHSKGAMRIREVRRC